MNNKISVIVPIYNVEKYLEKCLLSIINQTYKNIEIILVNDGSPDNSIKVCEKYRHIDNRIIIINKQNGGLSSARNAGLDIATGEYIAFVDSDDWIERTMLEELLIVAIENSADIVQCGFKSVFEDDQVKGMYEYKNEIITGNKNIIKSYFVDNKINSVVWNKLYKRELFNSIRMIVGKNNEDTMVTPELLLHTNKLINMEGTYYNYLQRPDTIMSSCFSEKKLDQIYASNYVIELCKIEMKDYLNYAYINHCLNTILLYKNLKNSKLDDDKIYEEIIIKEFKNAYKKIKDTKEFNSSSSKIKCLVKLFSVNKRLSKSFLNLYENMKVSKSNV